MATAVIGSAAPGPGPACCTTRSEEGRVGEEGRFRWWPDHLKKKKDSSEIQNQEKEKQKSCAAFPFFKLNLKYARSEVRNKCDVCSCDNREYKHSCPAFRLNRGN